MTASTSCQQWRVALRLWQTMPQLGVECDAITFGAAAAACEAGGLWRLAVKFALRTLSSGSTERSISPSLAACSAAIAACERHRRWQVVLQLLGSAMHINLEPNLPTLAAATLQRQRRGSDRCSEYLNFASWRGQLGSWCSTSHCWHRRCFAQAVGSRCPATWQ
ncbi:unnamed protein product, partial [Polarella glacialis]